MMTMEILLAELNAERSAKNEEIQRLKVGWRRPMYGEQQSLRSVFSCPQTQLTEKEMIRVEIQSLLDQFYMKKKQLSQDGSTNRLSLLSENSSWRNSVTSVITRYHFQ